MPLEPDKRERVLEAAAEVFAAHSIANASKREVARVADVPVRLVSEVGQHRVDLLRQVVEQLPFPPVAEHMAAQARNPTEPALQALMRAAREVLGDPGAAWDPLELQAILTAPYDEATRAVMTERLNLRWDAAREVVHQLRGPASSDDDSDVIGDDAAALHLIAVGLGLALLAPISDRGATPARGPRLPPASWSPSRWSTPPMTTPTTCPGGPASRCRPLPRPPRACFGFWPSSRCTW
jgi:AcrR family transcriptional regulator